MGIYFGGNADVAGSPIWEIAARNNQKEKRVIYRINGERVSKEHFIFIKQNKVK